MKKTSTYFEVVGTIDGDQDILFSSFFRPDCVYELEAERESWKEEGYSQIRITSRQTSEQPDPEVYKDDDLTDMGDL